MKRVVPLVSLLILCLIFYSGCGSDALPLPPDAPSGEAKPMAKVQPAVDIANADGPSSSQDAGMRDDSFPKLIWPLMLEELKAWEADSDSPLRVRDNPYDVTCDLLTKMGCVERVMELYSVDSDATNKEKKYISHLHDITRLHPRLKRRAYRAMVKLANGWKGPVYSAAHTPGYGTESYSLDMFDDGFLDEAYEYAMSLPPSPRTCDTLAKLAGPFRCRGEADKADKLWTRAETIARDLPEPDQSRASSYLAKAKENEKPFDLGVLADSTDARSLTDNADANFELAGHLLRRGDSEDAKQVFTVLEKELINHFQRLTTQDLWGYCWTRLVEMGQFDLAMNVIYSTGLNGSRKPKWRLDQYRRLYHRMRLRLNDGQMRLLEEEIDLCLEQQPPTNDMEAEVYLDLWHIADHLGEDENKKLLQKTMLQFVVDQGRGKAMFRPLMWYYLHDEQYEEVTHMTDTLKAVYSKREPIPMDVMEEMDLYLAVCYAKQGKLEEAERLIPDLKVANGRPRSRVMVVAYGLHNIGRSEEAVQRIREEMDKVEKHEGIPANSRQFARWSIVLEAIMVGGLIDGSRDSVMPLQRF